MHKIIFTILILALPTVAEAQPCKTLKKSEGTLLLQCGKLKVLRLEGTPEVRERNHGALLGKELSMAPLNYFTRKTLDPARKLPRPLQWIVEKALNVWVRMLHRGAPDYLKRELDAFAEGAGMDPIDVRRAVSVPDIGAFLVKWSANSMLQWIPTAGCTSVAKKFPGGGFAYGRNLDFAGVRAFDTHPLLTLHIPPPGTQELKHAAFGADGAGFAGITGFNEAGITFAVHQNYSRVGKVGGVPMFVIGDAVLRRARSIEDAVNELRKLRPSPLWTFVVTDLKVGKAVAVETSMEGFAVREMNGDQFAQTNHVQTEPFLPLEHISIGTKYNSRYRFEFALKKLAELRATDEPRAVEKLAAILSHHDNPSGDLTGYHDVIKAHTIQTVFLQQRSGNVKLLMSMDEAPTSSGAFAEFDAADLWSFDEALRFETRIPAPQPKSVREKQKAISRAFAQYFDEHDRVAAIKELENQKSLDARLFTAVALYQDKAFDRAATAAREALDNPKFLSEPAQIRESLERVELISLWKADKRKEALFAANRILSSNRQTRPGLHNLAKALVKEGSPGNNREKITFEFFSGDLGGITEP